MPLFSDTLTGASLTVRVTPRAGRTALGGITGAQLRVRLAPAPVDHAANDAMIDLMASVLRVPRSAIRVAAGARSRTKRIVVEGLAAADLNQRLAAALAPGS